MITFETGTCTQGCKMPYLSIAYEKSWHRFGLRIRGCGGPYHAERAVPGSALRTLQDAKLHGLPIGTAILLAKLQRDAESGIARLIQEKQIEREEGERFLGEVFP